MKFFGRKKETDTLDDVGRLTGVKRKAKIGLTLAVVGMVLAGASTGLTARGFSKGEVVVSEYFVVDARAGTGTFWVELGNRGLLPLKLDVTFTLRHGASSTDLGSQVASFKLGPRGSDNQTFTFHLSPTALAALVNGAVLQYTPSVEGDYAWFIPVPERDLDSQTLTVRRDNQPPLLEEITLRDIDTGAKLTAVEAGTTVAITLVASDADGDSLNSEFTLDGGSVLAVEQNGLQLRWQAPYGEGSYELAARISDGVDFSAWRSHIIPVEDSIPPVLALTAEPDYDNDTFDLRVVSNEPLLEPPTVSVVYDNGSGPGAPEQVTLSAMTPTAWEGTYDLAGSGSYDLTAQAEDFARNPASHSLDTVHVVITVVPGTPETVTGDNVSLLVNTTTTVTAPLSVSVAAHGDMDLPDDALAVGRYLSIDTNASLRDNLQNLTVRIDYTAADVAALEAQGLREQDLKLYYWDGSEWVWESNATVDTEAKQLVVVLDHLSLFSVFGSNIAPTADGGSAISVGQGSPAPLNGIGSDVDGSVAFYEWDFDDDGEWDWNSTVTGITTHKYPAAGVYTARLRVTDDGGATSFDTVLVNVGTAEAETSWGMPGPGLAAALLALGLAARRRRW